MKTINTHRNIDLSFTAREIDVLAEALTTVTGAPKQGVPALLKRIEDITDENNASNSAMAEEDLQLYIETGMRSFKLRKYLNRKRYAAATDHKDTTADDWADLIGGHR